MAETAIQWTATRRPDRTLAPGYTFNPWRGCWKVDQECVNCYAEVGARRNPRVLGVWGKGVPRAEASDRYWRQPLKWNADAALEGVRRKVFCASYADVFEDHAQLPPLRARLFELIAETPWLDWLLLTKRPQNMVRFLPKPWPASTPPANVWLGTSVGYDGSLDRVVDLLRTPAHIHFVSVEPMLGRVPLDRIDFTDSQDIPWVLDALRGEWWTTTGGGPYPREGGPIPLYGKVDWVICGGESGSKARPFDLAAANSLRGECASARVPFFMKQLGSVWAEAEDATNQKGGDPEEWPRRFPRQWPGGLL